MTEYEEAKVGDSINIEYTKKVLKDSGLIRLDNGTVAFKSDNFILFKSGAKKDTLPKWMTQCGYARITKLVKS